MRGVVRDAVLHAGDEPCPDPHWDAARRVVHVV